MKNSIAILAGGLGTRLGTLTDNTPKALIKLNNEPFLGHQLKLLEKRGFRHVVLCLGHFSDQIEQYLAQNTFQLDIAFSYDGEKLLGTGGAIIQAAPMLTEDFFILYGDSYLDIDYSAVLKFHESHPYWGTMTVLNNHDQWDTSNIVYENDKIVMYDKINRSERMKYIDYGLSILSKKALATFSIDTAFDLSDIFKHCISHNQMQGFEIRKRFYEVGSPQGVKELEAYLQKEYIPATDKPTSASSLTESQNKKR